MINPDNDPAKKEEYRLRLAGMSDLMLFSECNQKIWLSAYASNNPQSCYHWQADYTYDEAVRRGAPKIYSDAYRAVRISEGYGDPHPDGGLGAK